MSAELRRREACPFPERACEIRRLCVAEFDIADFDVSSAPPGSGVFDRAQGNGHVFALVMTAIPGSNEVVYGIGLAVNKDVSTKMGNVYVGNW